MQTAPIDVTKETVETAVLQSDLPVLHRLVDSLLATEASTDFTD